MKRNTAKLSSNLKIILLAKFSLPCLSPPVKEDNQKGVLSNSKPAGLLLDIGVHFFGQANLRRYYLAHQITPLRMK